MAAAVALRGNHGNDLVGSSPESMVRVPFYM